MEKSLQRSDRARGVGRCEPGSSVDGLHDTCYRLRSLGEARYLVRRAVCGWLGSPLEVPVAILMGRVSHGVGVSSCEDSV